MMEYKGYIGKVDFDDEANIFHGEVINVRDVITFQGESVQEIRQAFNNGDLCAKARPNAAQFKANNAGANYAETFWYRGFVQGDSGDRGCHD